MLNFLLKMRFLTFNKPILGILKVEQRCQPTFQKTNKPLGISIGRIEIHWRIAMLRRRSAVHDALRWVTTSLVFTTGAQAAANRSR